MNAALTLASTLGNTFERIGAYGGLASMIGLGVLALLYFAQAREVKRLREWAGRAPERAAEVEQRVQADAQKRVIAQPQTPAGLAATPAGAAPPARLPTAGLTGEAATRAAGAAILAARATHPPAPAVGPAGQLARPNLPTPPVNPQPAAPAAGAVPPATGTPAPAPGAVPPAPGSGPSASPHKPGAPSPPNPAAPVQPANAPAAKPAVPAPASAAALAANRPTATASSAPAAPAKPRVVAQPPAATNGGGQETRESAAARPLPPPPAPPTRPTATAPPAGDGDGSSAGRMIAIIGGALGLVLIVGLIVILIGGDDPTPTKRSTIGSAPPAQATPDDPGSSTGSQPVVRGDTATTVLNGTVQAGLASTVASKLKKAGFKVGDPADNVDQTLDETAIYYTEGNERAANEVARVIGVKRSAVQPEDRNAAVAGSGADVVVTVGADLIE